MYPLTLKSPVMALTVMALTQASWATAASGQSLDELIQKFDSDAPKIEAEVQIDAWVEHAEEDGQPHHMMITVLPGGDTRLNADPGITVTPVDQIGIEWQTPLPHRHLDHSIDYFKPPATLRLPFTASDDQPVELLVEYAYCFVDFQCFFGEEELTVTMSADSSAS